jgi:hypothetical protein
MEIYRILNKVNGKSYIGVTESCFSERYPQGKWWKWTHSLHLKSAVEKYGLENFEKTTLWQGETSSEDLIEKERMAITEYNAMVPNGYNLIFGGKNSKPPTHVKTYEIIRYDGKEFLVKNLSKFCRDNKLSYGAMLNMVCGINKSSQGFALKGQDISQIKPPENQLKLENIFSGEIVSFERDSFEFFDFLKKQKMTRQNINLILAKEIISKLGWKKFGSNLTEKDYHGPKVKATLFHKSGRKVNVTSVYKFCKDEGLNRASIYDLIKGKAIQVKGWSLTPDQHKIKEENSKRLGKTINLISPQGEKLKIKNISKFCRENGFILGRFYFWITKQQKSHFHGWAIDKDVNI